MKLMVRSLCSSALMAAFMAGCTFADRSINSLDDRATTDALLAGHSAHGEAFNDGPRQAAYLFPGTGAVHFPVTTTNSNTQAFFDQGLGQLHGFWYFEAERSFRQAATFDPNCAMLYWGMAQANFNNEKRARGFIAEAMKRRSSATKIERLHIEACAAYYNETDKAKNRTRCAAYLNAFTDMMNKYPDDIETAALAVRYRWEFRKEVKLSDDDYNANNKLLDHIFARNPMHPAHHYGIHLWDEKEAKNALASAAACGQSSPSIAHMWHMPGHIYDKLKRFDDAAWQQEASARVDHAQMMRDHLLPDQIHNYAHNNEWLCRVFILTGRMSDALGLAHNMASLPRHPTYNTLQKGSSKYAIDRLYDIHYQFELWDALLTWTDQLGNDPTLDEQVTLNRLQARGVAFAHTKKMAELAAVLVDLEKHQADLEKRQTDAGEKAFTRVEKNGPSPTKVEEKEPESEDQTDIPDHKANSDEEQKVASTVKKTPAELAKEKARKGFDKRIKTTTAALIELRALASLAAGPSPEAKKLLAACANVVPPLRLARYYLTAEDHEQALIFARKAVAEKNGDHNVVSLALLAHVLFTTDHLDEARSTFTQLRDLSCQADLTSPPLARLAPLAQACAAPADWRTPMSTKSDVGQRPALDTLGPIHWQPSPALPWSLPDADGNHHQLSDYRGKPVIVIFYLGYGCVHCTEQLAAFWPMAQRYKDAGINLIGVSTDSVTDLKLALAPAKVTHEFPFPLVADPTQSIFKRYRAFDDFEQKPLHGTFLIDTEGKVRWQDISFEPFMDAAFLLEEAKRLLALPSVL
jgi:peroxiredoxin